MSSRHQVSFSVGKALRKDRSKDFLMSTGKNILTMAGLVSKCDFTLEVLNSETPDARDKGDRTDVLYFHDAEDAPGT